MQTSSSGEQPTLSCQGGVLARQARNQRGGIQACAAGAHEAAPCRGGCSRQNPVAPSTGPHNPPAPCPTNGFFRPATNPRPCPKKRVVLPAQTPAPPCGRGGNSPSLPALARPRTAGSCWRDPHVEGSPRQAACCCCCSDRPISRRSPPANRWPIPTTTTTTCRPVHPAAWRPVPPL